MSNSPYIKIKNVDQFVSQLQLADSAQASANLQLALTIPSAIKVGDKVRVLIEGPQNTSYTDLILSKDDMTAKEVSFDISSSSFINDSALLNEGDYQIVLGTVDSSDTFSPLQGHASFTLETTSTDVVGVDNVTVDMQNLGVSAQAEISDKIQIDLDDAAAHVVQVIKTQDIDNKASINSETNTSGFSENEANTALNDQVANVKELQADNVEAITLSSVGQILRVKDNHGSYKGVIDTQEFTNDRTPKLVGRISAKLEEGEFLNVYRDGDLIGQASVRKHGENPLWSFKDNDAGDVLVDGKSYEYTVQVANHLGETSDMSQAYVINIDTTGPSQIAAITSYSDNVVTADMLASTVFSNENSVSLQGTLDLSLAAGESLNVIRNGRVIGKAEIDDNDADNIVWHFDQSALKDGQQYNYQVQVVDAASNKGVISKAFKFNVDTTAPEDVTSVEIQGTYFSENNQDLQNSQISIKVGVSSLARVGDVIEIDVNGDGVADATHQIGKADLGKKIDISIAGEHFNIQENAMTANVKVVDQAQNESEVKVDHKEFINQYDVDIDLGTLFVAQDNGNTVIGFDLGSINSDYASDARISQTIKTDAPQGTAITVEISITIPGEGVKKFSSFEVMTNEQGDYNFNQDSIPASVWSDFSDILTGDTTISNVTINAFIGTAGSLKSNVATQNVLSHTSPLILDLDGDGVETINIDEGGSFDINADTMQEFTGWVGADDALLVRDIDGNGNISDAKELFGEYTVKQNGEKAKNGFDALADLDSNNDGVFDQSDAAFGEVKIWQDVNSDGVSQANELKTLDEAGVKSINTSAQKVSEVNEGNLVGLRSSWTDTQDKNHDVDDVWFAFNELDEDIAPYIKVIKTDNYINAIEVGDEAAINSDIQVKVVIPPGTALGETLAVFVAGPSAGKGFSHVTVSEDFTRGYILYNIPNENLQDASGRYDDGEYNLSLALFTPAGAYTPYAGKDSFILDTIAPDAPAIEIASGADNTLNIAELAANIMVNITLPGNAVAGDRMEIDFDNDGSIDRTYIIQASDLNSVVSFEVDRTDLAIDSNSKIATVQANIIDVAGNVGEFGSGVSGVDISAPDSPSSVEIINGSDDFLDNDELSADVIVKVGILGTASVGDKLHLDVNEDGIADVIYEITTGDIGSVISITVPGNLFSIDLVGNEVTATAWIVNESGNPSSNISDKSAVVLNIDPNAADDTYNIEKQTNFKVLNNDTDADGDDLSITSITEQPEHGSVEINNNGTITYTPDTGYEGADKFKYQISDGEGGTDSAYVYINVLVALEKPTIDLAASSDSGRYNFDNLTNDTTPTLQGTATANVTVTVYADGKKIAETTSDANGNWSVESKYLVDGPYTLTAIGSLSGRESPTSDSLGVVIDTVVDASMSLPAAQEGGAWFGHAPAVKFQLTTTEQVTYSVKDVAFHWGGRAWVNPGRSITANGEGSSSKTIDASNTASYSHGWFTFEATLTDLAGNVKTTNLTPVVVDPIASLKDGGYIVTFLSPSSDSQGLFDVKAQRYDVNGQKVNDSFVVNSYIKDEQINADVTGLEDGGFVITWQSNEQDGDGFGIYGQRYDENSNKVGDEFQINTVTVSDQQRPEITSLDDGGYVVTWMSKDQDGSENGVYIQIFNSAGDKVSTEILVNSNTDLDQALPSITHLSSGGFVVSWQSNHESGSGYDIYGKVFSAEGVEIKSEFIINTQTADTQILSNISNLSDGGFVTSWLSKDADNKLTINVQRFDANANRVFLEDLVINQDHEVVWSKPEIAGLNDGSFVVTWSAVSENGSDIYFSKFDKQGKLLFSEQLVNSEVDGVQSEPHIVALENGGYLITWTDIQIEAETVTVMGQQFDANDQPVNQQFEVGQVVSPELDTAETQVSSAADKANDEIGLEAETTVNDILDGETEVLSVSDSNFTTNSEIEGALVNIAQEKNNVLDLSDLLERDDVQMDSLDNYIHFAQEGDDLLVYVDENGGFTEESFDADSVTDIITLHDITLISTEYEDVMKELLSNNQILLD